MSLSKQGFVYLIGAGPGDPGLITLKGWELLRQCDVVVYDKLIPSELIVTLSDTVEKIYVGKSAGAHSMSQDKINELIVKLAKENKIVARLKGGDPLIFGRCAEEAEFLANNNIRFEIIPGVTSGSAAPAFYGIPCTDRHKASYTVFATGHKAIEKEYSRVPWDQLGKFNEGTLIIYMGVGELPNIVKKLLDAGMPEDKPTAIIERGTFPTGRIVKSGLKDLPENAKKENIKPPSIVIIGDVTNYHPILSQLEPKALHGLRIMVTRPADQAADMYRQLREQGAEVLPYPTIKTKECIDSVAWDKFEQIKNGKKWLAFTSENCVRYFIGQFLNRYGDIRKLSEFKIAAVGIGTTNALSKFNLKTDFLPDKATVSSFTKQFCNDIDFSETTVVRIRGSLGNNILEDKLRENGVDVLTMKVYNTETAIWQPKMKEALFEYPPNMIIFTSGSSFSGLCEILSIEELKQLSSNAQIVSIGPSTSKIIKSQNIKVDIEAKTHSIPGIISEIIER
jgi:uroporphyrinogen III methyltransferase/synthase